MSFAAQISLLGVETRPVSLRCRLPQSLLAHSEIAGLKSQPTYLIWLELNRAKPLRKIMRPTTAAGTSM